MFLVLVVELVMEGGGTEGFQHQAKVRSCGATGYCHQYGNIGVTKKTANILRHAWFGLMSHIEFSVLVYSLP